MSVQDNDTVNFAQFDFHMSPSLHGSGGSCELIVYHKKILRTQPKPRKASTVPLFGSFDHKIFQVFLDRITFDEFFAEPNIKKHLFDILVKIIPTNMPKQLYPKITVHLKNFVEYEYKRFKDLERFTGSREEAWKYYKPIATEYFFNNDEIGITFKADVIFLIPANFHGDHPAFLRIADYKTGRVPSFSKGIGFYGERLEKPVMIKKVREQILFEATFIDRYPIIDHEQYQAMAGTVIYTIDGTNLTDFFTNYDKNQMIETLKKWETKITRKGYFFNNRWCKYCEFYYACMGQLSTNEKVDLAILMARQNKKKGESQQSSRARHAKGRQLLLQKIETFHQRNTSEVRVELNDIDDIDGSDEQDIDGTE